MNRIRNFFVCAKPWQVFLVFAGQFCAAEVAISTLDPVTASMTVRNDFPFFAVLEVFSLAFAVWLWSLGSFIDSVVASPLRLNRTFFRIAVIYPPVCEAALIAVFSSMSPMLFVVIFPLSLFAVFCTLYSWYFISKSLALAEGVSRASFPTYVGSVLCLWFFPIGVWFIQPRINRLYESTLSRNLGS